MPPMNIRCADAWSARTRNSRATPPRSAICRCRACWSMNDANYPWLILVPRRPGVVEIIDLDDGRAGAADGRDRARRRARSRTVTGCDKLNVAAIGNVVPQLHVHIIARRRDDPAWPKPVWGAAPPRAYEPAELEQFVARVAQDDRARLSSHARADAPHARASFAAPPEFMHALAPISGRGRGSAIPPAVIDRAAERRGDERLRRCSAMPTRRRLCDRRRTRGPAQDRRTGSIRCSRWPRRARSAPTRETVFLGLLTATPTLRRSRSIRTPTEALKARADLAGHRSALDRGAGPGRAEHLPPLAEGQGAARLARAPSLLLQLRRADRRRRGRLAARLPELQGAAFPAHRSGRHHAGDRRRPLPARPRRRASAPACGRASRASSSRARRSRMRCGARRWRKPASSAAT